MDKPEQFLMATLPNGQRGYISLRESVIRLTEFIDEVSRRGCVMFSRVDEKELPEEFKK